MEKKYEITIRELTPFTEDELKESRMRNNLGMDSYPPRFSDKPFHEMRVLTAELSETEFQNVKKAVINGF